MKKIALIIFTFSGIYRGLAQFPVKTFDSAKAFLQGIENHQAFKKDAPDSQVKAAIRLFPNPAKNRVEIELIGFAPGPVKIQLIDANGKLVKEEQRLIFNGHEIIVLMFSEKPGLYSLWLRQREKILKNKLIIQ